MKILKSATIIIALLAFSGASGADSANAAPLLKLAQSTMTKAQKIAACKAECVSDQNSCLERACHGVTASRAQKCRQTKQLISDCGEKYGLNTCQARCER